MERTPDVEVLVAGAGPAGLALALELGRSQRRCLLIDAQLRKGMAPRAKTTNVRTRELLRRWGIADRLAALAPFGVDHPSEVVFATSMQGPELARFHNAFYCAPVRDERFAEHAQWVPQYRTEEVLRQAALACPGVQMRDAVKLVEFTQDDQGVLATLEDTEGGRRWQQRCRYLVGADGARSTVREQLGIEMDGVSPLGQHRNFIVHAPGLGQRQTLGPGVMYWLVNARAPAVAAPLEAGDIWTYGSMRATFGEDPLPVIRSALGPDARILAQDDWTAHQLIARAYQDGRVFLIGDACHLHPPFGGHGMNMGIGDGVDLGWKLSATLAGWGGPQLLGSYETERRQVHRRVVDESTANHKHLPSSFWQDGLDAPGPQGQALRDAVRDRILQAKRQEFDSLGLVIGYHYEHSPLLLRESADQPEHRPGATYQPSARPGCRCPHAWLGDGSSLFDHFDPHGWTLLSTAGGPPTLTLPPVPLRTVTLREPGLRELLGADHVLIRPDQHVAWRGNDLQRLPQALQQARGHGPA